MSAESSLLAVSRGSRFGWFGRVERSGQQSPHKEAFEAFVFGVCLCGGPRVLELDCCLFRPVCLIHINFKCAATAADVPLPLQPRFQPQVSSHMKNVEFSLFRHLRHSFCSQATCMSPKTQYGASTGLKKSRARLLQQSRPYSCHTLRCYFFRASVTWALPFGRGYKPGSSPPAPGERGDWGCRKLSRISDRTPPRPG